MKTCQKCEAEMAENLKFCKKCGTPFTETAQIAEQNVPAVPKSAKSVFMNKAAVIAIGVVCLCGIIGYIALNSGETDNNINAGVITDTGSRTNNTNTEEEIASNVTELEYVFCEELDGLIIIGYKGEPRVDIEPHSGDSFSGSYISFPRLTDGELDSEVYIPEKIDGYTVKRIGDFAFAAYEQLISIRIPDSVTEIGYSAFQHCLRLNSITFPSNLESIENYAFWGCVSLPDITIPDSVISIGKNSFLLEVVGTGGWTRTHGSQIITYRGNSFTQENIRELYNADIAPLHPDDDIGQPIDPALLLGAWEKTDEFKTTYIFNADGTFVFTSGQGDEIINSETGTYEVYEDILIWDWGHGGRKMSYSVSGNTLTFGGSGPMERQKNTPEQVLNL